MKKIFVFLFASFVMILVSGILLAYHPLPYYGVENEQYNTATDEYVSPHLKWAKPYIKGRARVLIIMPRWGMREAIELTQRMDLDATIFASGSRTDIGIEREDGGESWEGFSFHSRTEELEKLASEQWDAVISAGIEGATIPVGVFLRQVQSRGMGYLEVSGGVPRSLATVLTHHDNVIEEQIMKPIPVENVSVMKEIGRDSLLLAGSLGKGRIAHLRIKSGYRGGFSGDVSNAADFEYFFALVIRTVAWIAHKESPVEIESLDIPRNYQLESPPTVRIVADKNRSKGLTPRLEILRKGERFLSDAVVPVDATISETQNGYQFIMPRLPGGEYYINVHLEAANVQAAWFTEAFAVETSIGLNKITTDKLCYQRGETVNGQVEAFGTVEQGSKVIVSVRDGFGRIMTEKILEIQPGQKSVRFN